jgi:hypothetical protein
MMQDLLNLATERNVNGEPVYDENDIIVVVADADYKETFRDDFDKPFYTFVAEGGVGVEFGGYKLNGNSDGGYPNPSSPLPFSPLHIQLPAMTSNFQQLSRRIILSPTKKVSANASANDALSPPIRRISLYKADNDNDPTSNMRRLSVASSSNSSSEETTIWENYFDNLNYDEILGAIRNDEEYLDERIISLPRQDPRRESIVAGFTPSRTQAEKPSS